MSLPTAEEITNLYLYGSKVKPANILDDSLIQTAIKPSINVDINEYMEDGPGRFASPIFFEVVKLFFSDTTLNIAPGTYTELQMRQILGTNQAIISQQQWAYDDGQADYVQRVYIWNSVAFEIDDKAQFIVDVNGNRYIENFSIVPWSNNNKENFDFESDDWIATLGNKSLEERVDPSGIGQEVEIIFDGNRLGSNYQYSDFQNDIQNVVFENPLLLSTLDNEISGLTDTLFENGAIKFLDGDKPVIYGTIGNDGINGTITTSNVDLSEHHYLKEYLVNGVHYISGEGADTIVATDKNDILDGGIGSDLLMGEYGEDKYIFKAGDGRDTIIDSDGSGKIIIDGNELKGSSQNAQLVNGNLHWNDAQNFHYELNQLHHLVITGGTLQASDQITIKNFDLANKDLGIELNSTPGILLIPGNEPNPFYQPNPDTEVASSEVNENGSQTLKVALNQPAQEGDKILISASGGDTSLLFVTTGAETIELGGDPVELILNAGQTEVIFMVANTGDLDATAQYTLSAGWQKTGDDSVSVNADFNLTVKGIDEDVPNTGGIQTFTGGDEDDDFAFSGNDTTIVWADAFGGKGRDYLDSTRGT